MTIKKALERGLDNIRTYGWIQGQLGGRAVGFCAIGALPEVSPDADRHRGARTALVGALSGPDPDLVEWNDHGGRTQADVEALYGRAIAAQKAA